MSNPIDHSLDPENFDSFRRDAHTLLDACLDHLKAARERPWQPVDGGARAALAPDMPETGIGESRLARELAERVLPFATGNTHPRYVERAVIDWTRRIFGFPETASGLLTSGTSQSTVIALAAARVHRLGRVVRTNGLRDARMRLPTATLT